MDTYEKHYKEFRTNNEHLFIYRRKRRTKLFIKIALLEAFIIFFAVAGASVDLKKAIIFSAVCAVILPFFLFDPQDYFKKPFIGKIIGEKYMMRYVFPKGVIYGTHRVPGVKYGFKSFIRYTVKDEIGCTYHFTLPQEYKAVYRNGDTVMRISGLDYPVCFTKRKHTVCMKCGALFIPHKDTCDALWCGAPLPVIAEENDEII